MPEEPRPKKGRRTYRDRAETELRSVRTVLKDVTDEEPQAVAARHVQIATTLALLDLADAIRNGGEVG